MTLDPELARALASRAQKVVHDTVAVFRLRPASLDELVADATRRAIRFVHEDDTDRRRFPSLQKRHRTVFHLPEGGRLSLFHASGAMEARRGWNVFERRISDRNEVDREILIGQSRRAVQQLGLDTSAVNETLEFERLWLLKSSGMSSSGQRGMTSVLRAVAAFRRTLDGLPVLGRASVTVRLAANGEVDAWGRDWRPVEGLVERTLVADPDHGARAILEDLQTRLPGDRFTLDDLDPLKLELGYLALERRRPQTILQPVWVGQLLPRGPMGVAYMIAVPAAPAAYEPIGRVLRVPPRLQRSPSGRRQSPHDAN